MDVKTCLLQARKKGASDVHLVSGQPPKIRVNGAIESFALGEPINESLLRSQLQSLLTIKLWDQFLKLNEIDIALELPDSGRFRLNLFHRMGGVAAVFRCIPAILPTLTGLACPPLFARLAEQTDGLVLVAGPTGSGKSTTLAAMIHHINLHKRAHVLTLEDPIEYLHVSDLSLINQREMGTHSQGFAPALRAALRQDPDVILVGEMRDNETMRLALTAAETGHLVLSSVHARTAPEAVDRVIDAFPSDEKDSIRCLLASALSAVISQVLVPALAGGRVAVWEIMVTTPAVRNLIRENRMPQLISALQTGQGFGMQTRAQHLQQLSAQGLIAPASVD